VERALAQRAETEQHPLIVAIEQRMPAIASILPAAMDPVRFQSIVISAVVQNPDLLTCDPASVIDAVVTAAREGLEPTGASGGAWLVPFYDKGVRKAQLIRDYRGIAKLLIAGGTVKRIDTSPVRAGDEFEYELGMHPRLVHKPKVGNDAEAHSWYAIAWMPDSDLPKVEVMTRAQVEHIRDKTKSRDRDGNIVGPWATDFDQMGRKTVMKRLANNQLPINHEVRAQLTAEDVAEFGDGVVISRVPAADLTERRAAIAERTARLTGGTEKPEQESEPTKDGKATSAGAAPVPAPKRQAPEPSMDDAGAPCPSVARVRGPPDSELGHPRQLRRAGHPRPADGRVHRGRLALPG
jgi:recombination protein RecT